MRGRDDRDEVGIVESARTRWPACRGSGRGGRRQVRSRGAHSTRARRGDRADGVIGSEKLDEAVSDTKDYVRRARRARCDLIQILVTSPGRQAANGEALVAALEDATGVAVRVLGRDEEGELAWRGAVACARSRPSRSRSATSEAARRKSRSARSRRVQPGRDQSTSARCGLRAPCSRRIPPEARAHQGARRGRGRARRADPSVRWRLWRRVAPRALCAESSVALSAERARGGAAKLGKRTIAEISQDFGVDHDRARTFLAGTMILAGIQLLLATPLAVAQGGLREGAALALLEEAAAATG